MGMSEVYKLHVKKSSPYLCREITISKYLKKPSHTQNEKSHLVLKQGGLLPISQA